MDPRGALAKLFLAGRSPEEQAQRILQQKLDAGLMGPGAGAPAQAPVAATDPLKTAGVVAAAAPSSAPVPIPTPRPDQPYVPDIITGGPNPNGPPIPTPRPADAGLANPALQSVPPELNPVPMPPQLNALPIDLQPPPAPPSLMGVPDALRRPPPAPPPAQNIVRPEGPPGSLPQNAQPRTPSKPKADRKKQTSEAQAKFRKKTYGLGG